MIVVPLVVFRAKDVVLVILAQQGVDQMLDGASAPRPQIRQAAVTTFAAHTAAD